MKETREIVISTTELYVIVMKQMKNIGLMNGDNLRMMVIILLLLQNSYCYSI